MACFSSSQFSHASHGRGRAEEIIQSKLYKDILHSIGNKSHEYSCVLIALEFNPQNYTKTFFSNLNNFSFDQFPLHREHLNTHTLYIRLPDPMQFHHSL